MPTRPGPVTADDVDEVVGTMVAELAQRQEADWHVTAGPLEWDCWETVEHLNEGLFFYAMQLVPVLPSIAGGYPLLYQERRPGGPEMCMFAHPDQGVAGLLRILTACGGMLASLTRTTPPHHRAYHMWGHADPEGFAAMGVVELLVHWHDVADALYVEWAPDEAVCDRVLTRLFPDAPTDTDRPTTLLWATGRADLPDLARPGDDWRWYGEPR